MVRRPSPPLRWLRSFGATSYTVMRSTSSGGPYSAVASGVTGSHYTDTSVSNGTTYYYTVTAANSADTSGKSPADSATPVRPMVNVATGGTANDSANNPVNAARAFDRNSLTQWLYWGVSGTLRYDLGRTETVQRYAVTSANDLAARDPKDWQCQGSSDGISWTTLDTQINQMFTGRLELKSYTVARPASYRITGSTSPPIMATALYASL